MSIKKITVIGSGTMGNGIAQVFALHGFPVSMVDISENALKQGMDTVTKSLDRMVAKERISKGDKESCLQRIHTLTSLEAGAGEADLVVEAVTENKETKLDIFRELDRLAPVHAILASNTSSISITEIAAATKRPEQVAGMHFMNPVPVMKLVEVIKGLATSAKTTGIVTALAEKLHKTPVVVNDYPGFVSNRILMPMINEAVYTLFEGVAGAEEIDTVMKLGMSHPMGPLQLADLIGLDVCLAILKVLHEGFGNPKYSPCPLLVNMVAAGHLGRKSGKGFYAYS